MVREAERMAADSIPAPDLERAKRQVETALLFAAQGARGRAQTLVAAQMLSGDWRDWERDIERVRGLTAADVHRVAARVLVPARRTLVWIVPSKPAGEARR